MKARKNKKGTRQVILSKVGGEYMVIAIEKIPHWTSTNFMHYEDYELANAVYNLPLNVLCKENGQYWQYRI